LGFGDKRGVVIKEIMSIISAGSKINDKSMYSKGVLVFISFHVLSL